MELSAAKYKVVFRFEKYKGMIGFFDRCTWIDCWCLGRLPLHTDAQIGFSSFLPRLSREESDAGCSDL